MASPPDVGFEARPLPALPFGVGVGVVELLLQPERAIEIGTGRIQCRLEVAGAVISLTHAQRRATDLVIADPSVLTPVNFDINLMLEASVGRADAFGVGKRPEAEDAKEATVVKPAEPATVAAATP